MKRINDKGIALLELAIIIPLLAALVFGICEFGWAMYVTNTLGNAARAGARFAIVTDPLASNDPRVAARVRDCLTFSYAAGDLSVTNNRATSSEPVTVTVTLIHRTFTKFFTMLDGRPFTSKVTMRHE